MQQLLMVTVNRTHINSGQFVLKVNETRENIAGERERERG